MKKEYIIFFLCLFLLIGCENKKEEPKDEYISLRNEILDKNEYMSSDELPLDITIKTDRIDEEKAIYKIILDNPKENMKNMRGMIIYNYYTEEQYPTFGIFDETKELLKDDNSNPIEFVKTIETTKNLSKIDLGLKIWIEYTNDLNEKKEIYYKAT